MLNIILFGPPGSGKGTQAAMLKEKYNLLHISTGDLLRSEIGNKTPLGMEASKFMEKGMLVPDEVVIGMISSTLDDNPDVGGFIFDGFPRTIAQAEALDKLLEFKSSPISGFVAISVSEKELIGRLLNRGKTSGRADDKNEEVIKNRIEVYKKETSPVAGHYQEKDLYVEVEGEGSIDDIFGRLTSEIDRLSA